jgi:hypothetical protein
MPPLTTLAERHHRRQRQLVRQWLDGRVRQHRVQRRTVEGQRRGRLIGVEGAVVDERVDADLAVAIDHQGRAERQRAAAALEIAIAASGRAHVDRRMVEGLRPVERDIAVAVAGRAQVHDPRLRAARALQRQAVRDRDVGVGICRGSDIHRPGIRQPVQGAAAHEHQPVARRRLDLPAADRPAVQIDRPGGRQDAAQAQRSAREIHDPGIAAADVERAATDDDAAARRVVQRAGRQVAAAQREGVGAAQRQAADTTACPAGR